MRIKFIHATAFCALTLFSGCASSKGKVDAVSAATYKEHRMEKSEQGVTSRTLIVLFSSDKNSTAKIAQEIASVLDAQILSPEEASHDVLMKYSLIGFGSGIFDQKHHQNILNCAEGMNSASGQKVFIFSTSGVSREFAIKNAIEDPHDALRNILTGKGCEIVGEFNCPGLNKNSFLKFFGGMNKGRPNSGDLTKAKMFAENLRQFISTAP